MPRYRTILHIINHIAQHIAYIPFVVLYCFLIVDSFDEGG